MKNLFIIIALFLFILVAFLLSQSGEKSVSGDNLIKECAGYDWSDIDEAVKNDKPASFYLLASELGSLNNIYALIDRSFVISPADIRNLNLKILALSEKPKEDIMDLIGGMRIVYKFLERNDLPTKQYTDKLDVLEKHFKNYESIDEKIANEKCQEFLASLLFDPEIMTVPKIKNYNDLLKYIIQNYNSFLIQYGLAS